MTREEILACVRQALHDEFELAIEGTGPGSRLQQDLELDSIDFVALAVVLEQETGFLLKEERLDRLRTVHDIVEFVFELQGEATSERLR